MRSTPPRAGPMDRLVRGAARQGPPGEPQTRRAAQRAHHIAGIRALRMAPRLLARGSRPGGYRTSPTCWLFRCSTSAAAGCSATWQASTPASSGALAAASSRAGRNTVFHSDHGSQYLGKAVPGGASPSPSGRVLSRQRRRRSVLLQPQAGARQPAPLTAPPPAGRSSSGSPATTPPGATPASASGPIRTRLPSHRWNHPRLIHLTGQRGEAPGAVGANWQRCARMACVVLPVPAGWELSARIGSVVHGWRALCCQFGLGGSCRRELAALCTDGVRCAANSAGRELSARIGSVVHGWRALCCQFRLGGSCRRELAALCTDGVRSAADSATA